MNDEPDLPRLSAQPADPYYRDFAEAYDRYARGVSGDVEFYVDLARRSPSPVVELGVGTGRTAVPCAEAGARIVGIDRERAMLDVARRRATEAGVADRVLLVQGDMRRFALAIPVSLVTIPFRTFLHNLTTEDQIATLEACFRALRPGGRLAFNVFNPDVMMIARWMGRSRTHWEPFGGWEAFEAQNRYEPSAQIVRTNVRVRDGSGRWRRTSFRLRYVHRFEMQHLLERVGFEVQSLHGGFRGEPFEEGSTEMVWTVRRPG